MTMGIYKITNIKNNKFYIGSSKNIETRWNQHKLRLNKNNHHSYKLQRDWKEFGEASFTFELIDEISNEDQLKEYEQYWIDTLKPHKIGYNILDVADTELKKTYIQKWNDENGGFIFSLFRYNNCLFNDVQDVLQEDIFKLFYISTYLDYENCLLINRKDMRNLLNLSRERFDKFFNKMKKLNILIQEDKLLKINNQYLSKGILDKYTKQYNDFTRIYINSIRLLYDNLSVRKHKQIGALLKLIPYTHRDTNILCKNQIDELSEIRIITKRELSDILNYHRSGIVCLINDLNEICLNNKPLIKFDNNKIIINPRIIYGGSFKDEYLLNY